MNWTSILMDWIKTDDDPTFMTIAIAIGVFILIIVLLSPPKKRYRRQDGSMRTK